VEGNVARRAQRDLGGYRIGVFPDGRPGGSLSTSNPSRTGPPSSHSFAGPPPPPGVLNTPRPAPRYVFVRTTSRAEEAGGQGGRLACAPTAAMGPRTARRTTSSKGTIRLSMTGKPAAMQQALIGSQS